MYIKRKSLSNIRVERNKTKYIARMGLSKESNIKARLGKLGIGKA